MNALVNINVQTMTSLEISELVEKRHDNVKRTIESLVSAGVIVQPQIEDEQSKDAMGRSRITQVYTFTGEQGKRDSIIVVAQLCPEFTARLVDRWAELEKQVAGDLITLPNFFDPAEAARAWADQYEAKQVAFKERDHAIATKAEIGNRREATAMATASKFKRQCEKLKDKLGEAVDFAAVAAINSKLKTDYGNKEGRMLAKYSRENNLEIKKATVTGQRFNEVNSYHKDAWKAVFNIDLNILFNT